jgi:hypothetical protein
MTLECYEHDVDHPNETKDAFRARFLASLPKLIANAKEWKDRHCNVLIVHDELRYENFGEWLKQKLVFWRPPLVRNLPSKAQWACEALSEEGHTFEIGYCGGFEYRPCYVAIFLIVSGTC